METMGECDRNQWLGRVKKGPGATVSEMWDSTEPAWARDNAPLRAKAVNLALESSSC